MEGEPEAFIGEIGSAQFSLVLGFRECERRGPLFGATGGVRAPLLGAAFFAGPSKGVLWERPAKEPRCHSHKAAEAGRCAP